VAATPTPPPISPDGGKALRGCLLAIFEVLAAVFAGVALPFVILVAMVIWFWPWYSSISSSVRNLDNALITLASVAGVLWSGAIIAYSIHKKYTPPLRTGVQLLHFAFLAPIAGLIGQGASLRTAFYILGWFYIVDALFSVTNSQLLKPGSVFMKSVEPPPNESAEDAEKRKKSALARASLIQFFQRNAHGTRYFWLVAALCTAIVVTARQDVIAWACLSIIVLSLFLILPEVFSLVDKPDDDVN